MKTLGVIGGMGPQASIRFLDLVVQRCTSDFSVTANDEFPRILLSSLPAPDSISDRSREAIVRQMLADECRRLQCAGADFLVMTCNTMHLLEAACTSATSIPFLSIIGSVVSRCANTGIQTVGLLGSETTMLSNLYREPLERAGIVVRIPDAADRSTVVRSIRRVISGQSDVTDVVALAAIAARLQVQGAQSVILGCTELPLLLTEQITDVQLISSLDTLAEASCREIFT